ncbi:MAG: hypothetical protein PHE89_06300 [Alphaproteobacteria bacterium]|nr:hypothetical protein [Alphaproteobacteria bacterium]
MKEFKLSSVSISTKIESISETATAKELITQYLTAKKVVRLQESGKSPRMLQKWQKHLLNIQAAILKKKDAIATAISSIEFGEQQKAEQDKFNDFVQWFERKTEKVTA